MITLITGTPGAGKTLYMVSKLAKSEEFKQGRKIFVDGIKELKIPTDPIPEGHSISDMHIWLKEEAYHGSIVIIDEAQRIFPPRSSGSKAPDIVEFLHVHRHYGIDIYLITQMPKRIDSNVRDLVGAHYHIYKNKLGFRTQFYWDYCANNPKSESRNAQASIYRLDNTVYDLYKSAEIHTKIKQPVTRWLIAFPIALIVFLVSIFMFYRIISGKTKAAEEQAKLEPSSSLTQSVSNDIQNATNQIAQTTSLEPKMFVPTMAERPESKPIYDTVRQVKQYERIAGCIQRGKSCNCYSDQATVLEEISTQLCKKYVKNGLPFDPFRDKPQPQQATMQTEPQTQISQSTDLPSSQQMTAATN